MKKRPIALLLAIIFVLALFPSTALAAIAAPKLADYFWTVGKDTGTKDNAIILVLWNSVSGADYYKAQFRKNNGNWVDIPGSQVYSDGCVFWNEDNKTYDIRVAAVDGGKTGSYLYVNDIVIPNYDMGNITNFKVTKKTDKTITVTWDKVTGADRLYLCIDDGSYEVQSYPVSLTATSYTFKNSYKGPLTQGKDYTVWVEADRSYKKGVMYSESPHRKVRTEYIKPIVSIDSYWQYKNQGTPYEFNFNIDQSGYVTVRITDENKKTIRTIINNEYYYYPSTFTTSWDGRDKNGNCVPSGTYYIYVANKNTYGVSGDKYKKLTYSDYISPAITVADSFKYDGSALPIKITTRFAGTCTTRIVDSSGSTVISLESAKAYEKGSHTLQWDGKDSSGKPVKNGTYSIIAYEKDAEGKTWQTKKQIEYKDMLYPTITSNATYTKTSDNKHKIVVGVKFDCDLTIRITDANGKTVKNIVNYEPRTTGDYTEHWDGKDYKGNYVPSGTYSIYAIERDEAGNTRITKQKLTYDFVTTPKVSTDSSYAKTSNNQHLIKFSISQDSKVTVAIRDRNNKTIRYINNKTDYAEGTYSVYWDGKDKNGNVVKSGDYYIYVIRYNEDGSYKYSKKGLKVTIEQSPKISSNSTYTRTGKNRHLIKVDIAVPSSVSTCIRDANSKTIIYLENKVSHEDGQIKLYWDGKDKAGNDVANGEYYIYAIRYNSDGSYTFAKKKLILK